MSMLSKAVAPLLLTVALLTTATAAGAAPAPVSLGQFSSFAASDGGSYLVAGRGTVSIFRDGSDTPRTVTLPGARATVEAGSSGVGVWRDVVDGTQATYGLLDLATGVPRDLPGIPVTGLAMIGEMGAQWLQLSFDLERTAFRLNWHTGERSQTRLPKGRTPQTALDSPTLEPSKTAPYVTSDSKGRRVYQRGKLTKRISGNCSFCGGPVVIGYRVAWIEYVPAKNAYTTLHAVNVKTGKAATVKLSQFPGATTATLTVDGDSPPQFTATSKRLVLSVTADRGTTWTLGSLGWPV
jgi:hypothetical protein